MNNQGVISWFARNEVAANLLMAFIVLLGLWTLSERVILEVFPAFERDQINIAASYRGASPAEIEKAVLFRIEDAVAGLDGITDLYATAFEDAGVVMIETESGRARELLEDIKGKVDAISTFPEDVERPTYAVQQFRRQAISVVVSGNLSERELHQLGDKVLDDLIALPEVNLAERAGVRPLEMQIEVDELTLARHNLTFDEVVQAISNHSADIPAGTLKSHNSEIVLRTQGQLYAGREFSEIPIRAYPDGSQLTLGELATVHDGFEENPLFSEFNGKPAVMIDVYRSGQQSVLDVSRAVRNYIDKSHTSMPQGIKLGYWRDRARIVQLRLNTLINSAWQGGLLVFLCLTLFLRLSVAFWVCVGIPISFLGALALLPEVGISLNIISLFAFILVLGIVVDDAIITGENIYAHLQRAESSLEAAIQGTREVAVPVTFGLLTTLAAFLPLFFIEGRRGSLFAQIPMVIVPVLVFSWIESKLILPAHLRHIRMRSQNTPGLLTRMQQGVADGLERGIVRFYQPLLQRALHNRYLTVALFIGITIIIISYVASGRYGFSFFPRVATETARATLVMQPGTPAHITEGHIRRMEAAARKLQLKHTDPATGSSIIHNVLISVGWKAGNMHKRDAAGQSELGQVSLELIPPEERTLPVTTKQLVKQWRNAIGTIPGSQELNYRAEIGRGGNPIDVQLTGDDFPMLGVAAARVRQRLAEYPGLFDIQDNFENGKPEVRLTLKAEAEKLGITTQELGRQVRQAFFGAEVQRIQRGRDDVRVIVRYPKEQRSSLDTLETMRLRTADGFEVPIGNVAEFTHGRSFSEISRIDRKRAINVTADLDKKKVDTNQIRRDLEPFLMELEQEYPGLKSSLEGELKEQDRSFGSLFYGTLLAFAAIYALLAIPLRSWSQPVLVMLVIPFSIVGALLGHMALGLNLSIVSIMGMLALGGVVVNDSLILVEWINRKVHSGMSIHDAVRSAGVARFRPILLTSLTTFFGLTPLILEKSTQAQFLIPMAVSLGFGILYATLISLILIPAGYLILQDLLGSSSSPKRP
ncbi:MAG: efflux RND transporter permease subunit [Gammaproteobacteria bacterium]|jgi:multidrug efflux pump subunit AcrB|nr:efflux RND transporter permease subunit [Gammaproteobacteria bacterium]MBT4605869.1 efflux RND transporter permease subunit [Thiotrichales bacterium]MBT3471553.1 efflux RND transporter permease subunit [Gammaproteobacteria bacterium]MBT3967871.1 efflux RND transporter permease subunit [Gammaproteobacteria bacterium]MBT4081553.1 efflux RND transporter permease subunit [Gammaproteobacteria bacterium]